MQPPPDPHQRGVNPYPGRILPGVSVREAADRLGVSPSTIRRMVAAGELDGGYFDRKGGTILRITLPEPDPPQAASGATPPPETTPDASAAPEATSDAPAVIMRLMDKLDERDALIQRITDRLAEIEREAGELVGAVDAYRRENEWLRAELERARRPWWRRLWS